MFDIIVVLWSWYMIRVVLYYHYIAQYFKWTNQTHTHTKSAAQPVPPGGAPFVINFVDRKCSQWHPSLFRTLNLFLELIGKLIFLITLNTHAQQEGLYCLLFCTCWLLNLSSAVKAFNSSPALFFSYLLMGGDYVLLKVDGLSLFSFKFCLLQFLGPFRATSAFYEAARKGRMCEC